MKPYQGEFMPGTGGERIIDIGVHSDNPQTDQVRGILTRKPRLLFMILVLLFLLAGAVRLYRLEAPGLLISRDYTSAILARAFYFESVDSIDSDRVQIATITRDNQPILEPPVTEFLVSLIYRAIGSEQLWVARLLTSSFWLIGGIFLFKIARTIVSPGAAVFATAYYLFVPLGVLLSRSFQPDSLMMMTFLISLYAILKYFDEPSDLRLIAVASIVGLTVLHRPLVLFAIFSTFTALAISRQGSWNGIIGKRPLLFFALSLLPTALYYGYGVFVAGFFRWKVGSSFQPDLLLHSFFWTAWVQLGVKAVGVTALAAALLGVPLLCKGRSRAFVIGLGAGYLAFGLVFTVHIHTHGYYHAQLIPIVALALGPLVLLWSNHVRQASGKLFWYPPVVGLLLLSILLGSLAVRSELSSHYQVVNGEEIAKDIGEIVDHSSRTVYVASYYGLPLQYYGELTGNFWPRRIPSPPSPFQQPSEREISIEDRLKDLGFAPEYFVIADFAEFNRHHADLKMYLSNNCHLLAESDNYLVYNDCVS